MEREGEARRFCEVCTKQVHDLSALTETQARDLLDLEFSKGRVCVRYKMDEDGAVAFAPEPGTVTYASSAFRTMLAAASMSLMLMTGCVDASPDRVEDDRCVHELGPWTIVTARGEGSCPAPMPALVGDVDVDVAGTIEEPPEMGEPGVVGKIEAIEPEPAVKGEVAPIEPEPKRAVKGKPARPPAPPPLPTELDPLEPEAVKVMGDVAAVPCDPD